MGLLVAFWNRMFLDKPPRAVAHNGTILPWNCSAPAWNNMVTPALLASIGSNTTMGAGPAAVLSAVFPFRTNVFLTSLRQLESIVNATYLHEQIVAPPSSASPPTLFRFLSFIQGLVALYNDQPLRYDTHLSGIVCGSSNTPGQVLQQALGACNQTLEFILSFPPNVQIQYLRASCALVC